MGGEQQGQAGAGRGLARGPQVLGRPAKPPQGLSPSPSRRGPRGAPFPEAAWFGSRPLARPRPRWEPWRQRLEAPFPPVPPGDGCGPHPAPPAPGPPNLPTLRTGGQDRSGHQQ